LFFSDWLFIFVVVLIAARVLLFLLLSVQVGIGTGRCFTLVGFRDLGFLDDLLFFRDAHFVETLILFGKSGKVLEDSKKSSWNFCTVSFESFSAHVGSNRLDDLGMFAHLNAANPVLDGRSVGDETNAPSLASESGAMDAIFGLVFRCGVERRAGKDHHVGDAEIDSDVPTLLSHEEKIVTRGGWLAEFLEDGHSIKACHTTVNAKNLLIALFCKRVENNLQAPQSFEVVDKHDDLVVLGVAVGRALVGQQLLDSIVDLEKLVGRLKDSLCGVALVILELFLVDQPGSFEYGRVAHSSHPHEDRKDFHTNSGLLSGPFSRVSSFTSSSSTSVGSSGSGLFISGNLAQVGLGQSDRFFRQAHSLLNLARGHRHQNRLVLHLRKNGYVLVELALTEHEILGTVPDSDGSHFQISRLVYLLPYFRVRPMRQVAPGCRIHRRLDLFGTDELDDGHEIRSFIAGGRSGEGDVGRRICGDCVDGFRLDWRICPERVSTLERGSVLEGVSFIAHDAGPAGLENGQSVDLKRRQSRLVGSVGLLVRLEECRTPFLFQGLFVLCRQGLVRGDDDARFGKLVHVVRIMTLRTVKNAVVLFAEQHFEMLQPRVVNRGQRGDDQNLALLVGRNLAVLQKDENENESHDRFAQTHVHGDQSTVVILNALPGELDSCSLVEVKQKSELSLTQGYALVHQFLPRKGVGVGLGGSHAIGIGSRLRLRGCTCRHRHIRRSGR